MSMMYLHQAHAAANRKHGHSTSEPRCNERHQRNASGGVVQDVHDQHLHVKPRWPRAAGVQERRCIHQRIDLEHDRPEHQRCPQAVPETLRVHRAREAPGDAPGSCRGLVRLEAPLQCSTRAARWAHHPDVRVVEVLRLVVPDEVLALAAQDVRMGGG